MKFLLLVVWCAYFVLLPKVKGFFFSHCDKNETLFVLESARATFNAEERHATRHRLIRFNKHNKTRHLVFFARYKCCDFSNISDLSFYDPWIEKRTRVTGDATNITITIDHVEKADNGTYVMGALDVHCFALIVIGIDKQPVGPIEEHSPAYFHAYPKASAIHRPIINATMMWLVDGMNISQSPLFVLQDGMIWLSSVSRYLNGRNITYRAVQDDGIETEANYTIEVTYGPEAPVIFSPDKEHYFLINGQIMNEVYCTVECNPPCKVSWDTHSKGNILSLGKVSTTMTGTYTCTATRPGSDITVKRRLVVQVEDEAAWQLQLSPHKTVYFVKAGDTLPDITCTANCNPPCEVSWEMDSNSGELSLGKVSSEMSGEYTCSAKRNDTDRVATLTITVYVQDTSAFTSAIAVLASIQAVTTIILILCGISMYRRNNAFPCQTCLNGPKPRNNGDKDILSEHENNRDDLNEPALEPYEDLDSDSRNEPRLHHYDCVQSPDSPQKAARMHSPIKETINTDSTDSPSPAVHFVWEKSTLGGPDKKGQTTETSMELYENTVIDSK